MFAASEPTARESLGVSPLPPDCFRTAQAGRRGLRRRPPGRDGFKHWAASARDAFPDLTGVVEDRVVEGDKVAARVTWRGTHHGEFLGVPGTGEAVEFAAFHIVRFSAGRAAEWWGTADLLGVIAQVGATITRQR